MSFCAPINYAKNYANSVKKLLLLVCWTIIMICLAIRINGCRSQIKGAGNGFNRISEQCRVGEHKSCTAAFLRNWWPWRRGFCFRSPESSKGCRYRRRMMWGKGRLQPLFGPGVLVKWKPGWFPLFWFVFRKRKKDESGITENRGQHCTR